MSIKESLYFGAVRNSFDQLSQEYQHGDLGTNSSEVGDGNLMQSS